MSKFVLGGASAIDLKWEQEHVALIAVISGRIDSSNVFGMEQSINDGLSTDHQVFVLDLSDVVYISSAALALMLRMAKRYREESKGFGVCTQTQNIREVIQISGFDRIINIYDTRDEALKELDSLYGP